MRVGILVELNVDAYKCIQEAAELGFQSGQIVIWDMSLYSEETAIALDKACKELDFEITAVWCGWSGYRDFKYPGMYRSIGFMSSVWQARRVEELLAGAAFARRIGVKNIITHVGYIPDNPYDPARMDAVQSIRYICKELSVHGQQFLMETGEVIPCTLIQIMCEVGMENLAVNFDPANLLINGRANPVDGLELLVPYVRGFHAKDGVYPEGINPKGKEMKIGEGRVDFAALMKLLAESGYDADVTIEREITDKALRKKEVVEEKEYLERLISRIAKS